MQSLIYFLFLSIFLFGFFNDIGIIPRALTYVPEMISGLMFIIILLQASKQRIIMISIGYWVLFLIIAIEILLGIILNNTPSGAIFAGLRAYLKYIPFFFLAAVYRFSENDIKKQLLLLLGLSILQLPVSIMQRIFTEEGYHGGDRVIGTIGGSGLLSIYLVCVFGVIFGFYLKGMLTRRAIIWMLASVSLPTMLNETKATLFILPFAILIPVLSMESGIQKARALRLSAIIFGVFVLVFIPIYDYFIWERYGYGLLTFFTMEGRLMGYLAPSLSGAGLGESIRIGRVDALLMPFVELSHDPTKLLLGLGIGNVSISFLGKRFSGEFMEQYDPFLYGSLTKLQWEIGIVGIVLIIILLYMLYRDARFVSKNKGISGAFALGWTPVPILMIFALLYSQVIANNIISYLFWYLSGYIMAEAARSKMSLLNKNIPYTKIRSELIKNQKREVGITE